jgi:hypothetical protein
MGKKLLNTVLMTVIVTFMLSSPLQNSFAQSTKKLDKQLQKEKKEMSKKKISEYKINGWELADNFRTLEAALDEHHKKLEDGQNKELIGDVAQCESINICRQKSMIVAQNMYVLLASANIRGQVEALARQDNNMTETEINKVLTAYEKTLQAEISGIITESFSIVRDNGDGTNTFQTIFIVNEEKASLVRKRAMDRSLQETKITLKEAEEISKFVQEGFNLE